MPLLYSFSDFTLDTERRPRPSDRRRLAGKIKLELTESTRQAIDDYLRVTGKSGEYLFTGQRQGGPITTRQYAPSYPAGSPISD
jgi:hypothetical protein